MKIGNYKITKGKLNKDNKNISKIRRNRHNAVSKNKRWFLTSYDMSQMKLDEAIAYSIAKREGKKLAGVCQMSCSCGAEGCNITREMNDSNVSLPKTQKKPTKHPKRSEHIMFSGKIVE